ncbi:pyrroline-5-carboxylate reductase [candidate division KSB3 bacterium]|uniref:Pyrroline-5-carboxylate reductase n=1 Tax=candidate division KSB3 bacterium TaxID=2044937 RepID=A0A2G6EBE4_9BACT|nr:MAG: pyrroline-5-carboxylate reductase [candidate division KSB3 bacterium]PIE30785.1 MAG: pyrroline-5-carboxylate reductase [candidate division KSB3 bacterium]
MLRHKQIGIIGAGNMAEALVRGLLQPAGVVDPDHLAVSDISEERVNCLRKTYGMKTFLDNAAVVKSSEILILAVKPQVVPVVLQEIAEYVDTKKLVVSIAAGVNIAAIQDVLEAVRIVRAMPNIAALVHAAVTALSPGKYATETEVQISREIFSAVGDTVVVEEKLMDAVTGLSGSGPSYVFHIINALADAGVKVGFSRDIAQQLAIQTLYGSAKMARESGKHPMQLRDMVTSPGGTSIAGVHALERGGLTATLIDAVEAATKRSQELGA